MSPWRWLGWLQCTTQLYEGHFSKPRFLSELWNKWCSLYIYWTRILNSRKYFRALWATPPPRPRSTCWCPRRHLTRWRRRWTTSRPRSPVGPWPRWGRGRARASPRMRRPSSQPPSPKTAPSSGSGGSWRTRRSWHRSKSRILRAAEPIATSLLIFQTCIL